MNLRPNIGADWDSNLFHFSNENLLLQAFNKSLIMYPNSIAIFLHGTTTIFLTWNNNCNNFFRDKTIKL